jgi:hypothetical protein
MAEASAHQILPPLRLPELASFLPLATNAGRIRERRIQEVKLAIMIVIIIRS